MGCVNDHRFHSCYSSCCRCCCRRRRCCNVEPETTLLHLNLVPKQVVSSMGHSRGLDRHKSKSNSRDTNTNTATATAVIGIGSVEFQTVLRIRPLLKREREDTILLEPVKGDGSSTVVLHPQRPTEILSPSSALVRQTVVAENVQTANDVEFAVDHVWGEQADQEKIYFSLGLPMALSAMEPLKVDTRAQVQLSNHLIIGMGIAGSGKTYSCWGTSNVAIQTKRKNEAEGLIPRIVDSLYHQSNHHLVNINSKRSRSTFAVQLSIIQVNQHKHKAGETQLHDLLQPVVSRAFSLGSSTSSTLSLSSTSLTQSPVPPKHGKRIAERSIQRITSSSSSSQYSSLEEPVFLEQDADADVHIVNGQIRTCRNAEDAREALQAARKSSARLSSRKYHSHVLVTLQPVILDRSGNAIRQGGKISVLDMAGCDQATGHVRANRSKESLPSRNDAHDAVLHCLRTHQQNEEIRKGRDIISNEKEKKDSSTAREPLDRRKSLRKIPYRQHKLTMLLQPLFSNKFADRVFVTLLVTVYPGHRDFIEKRTLLNDVTGFRKTFPGRLVATGVQEQEPTSYHGKKGLSKRHGQEHVCDATDGDDESSVESPTRKPQVAHKVEIGKHPPIAKGAGIASVRSLSYSNSTSDDDIIEPLPPPVAPSYNALEGFKVTAPMEEPSSFPRGGPVSDAYVSGLCHVKNGLSTSIDQTASEESAPPPPPFETYDNLDSVLMISKGSGAMSGSNRAVFSPMKTLNKVVHASKKKGKQVMEKLSTEKDDDFDLRHEIESLKVENEILSDENIKLRNKNTELEAENERLRDIVSRETRASGKSRSDFDAYAADVEVDQTGTSPTGSCSADDEDYERLTGRPGLVDDSLLAHMANVGGYSSVGHRWGETSNTSRSQFALNYSSTFQRTGQRNNYY